jgi:hypothetical protein
MSDVRKVTSQLIDLVNDGLLTWEQIAMECLSYMSECQVADMAYCGYLINDEIDDEAGE